MQLIAALPTLAVKTPSNVSTVHEGFSSIVNFEVLPKEIVYDWIVVPLFDYTNS